MDFDGTDARANDNRREFPEQRARVDIYSWISFTFPFNSTGQPGISLPNGFNKSGLPLALQIVGRPNDEAGVIALAAQFEEARPWKHHRPPVG